MENITGKETEPTAGPPEADTPEVLVLGIGNILLRDEGAGVRAVERLRSDHLGELGPEVELLDGGTSGLDLLDYLEGRKRVIIIDVVRSGREPGTLLRMDGEEVPALLSSNLSPHQLGISDVLGIMRLRDTLPESLVLFGLEPEIMEPGLTLSHTVEDALERLLAFVLEEIKNPA